MMNDDELLILLIGENHNIGAETFAREAIELDHDAAVKGLRRLLDWDIPGEYIYALWNDCCHRDTKLAIEVMNTYSKLRFEEAMDFFSYDRSKLKDLKKIHKMQQRIDLRNKLIFTIKKINIIVSTFVIVLAILNIFLHSQLLRKEIFILFGVTLLVICLNFIFDDFNIIIENYCLKEESAALDLVIKRLQETIEKDLVDERSKKVIKAIVENGNEEIIQWREAKWQRFAKKW